MKLSIAIITKDRCSELKRAVNSCISQNYKDTQFIIVDNGSTDNTIEYLNQLKKTIGSKVEIFLSDRNLGVAGGRNKAMELSDGEYVFFLDDDAIIMSDDLFSIICDYLDSHQDVGALALETLEKRGSSERFLKGPIARDSKDGSINMLHYIGCAHVIRKSVFKVGILYPSKLTYGSEEFYASLRIWNKGFAINYLDNVLIEHYPSINNRMTDRDRFLNIIVNFYIIKMLTYPMMIKLLTKAVFPIRLIKNGYFNARDVAFFRKMMKNCYLRTERDIISKSAIFILIRRFGLSNII